MSETRAPRISPVAALSLAIACFSLGTAMYQGYVQTQNLAAVQRDITRREQIRGCKDVIEAYFEAKLRIGFVQRAAAGTDREARVQREETADLSVSRLAAIGTFLANGESEEARARYTALTRSLEAALLRAGREPGTDRRQLFAEADGLFATMNEDCVRSARQDSP